MEVKFEVDGKSVYEIIKFCDGTEKRTKIRECRTEEEAKAIENYYKVRKE